MDDQLRTALAERHGLTVTAAVPVDGGWQNAKWRVSTQDGDWLLKVFSRERFPRRAQIDAIEAALHRQVALHAAGIPCPAISCVDGSPLNFLDGGQPYTVMRFIDGVHLDAETVSHARLYALGHVRAAMGRAFDALPLDGAKGYPPAPEFAATGYPMAIAHEDFSPDNILFAGDGVAAILDFDRSSYHFRDHDIGRALLSFCLRETDGTRTLDGDAAGALLSGYGLTDRHAIADALRATYFTEAPWWRNPDAEANPKPKIRRFCAELHWLEDNLDTLDSITETIKF